MNQMPAVPTAAGLLILLSAVALTGCATGTVASTDGATPSASTTPSASASASAYEEKIVVELADGRTLAASCSGEGERTVVYLHGLIQPGDATSWAHAPELRSRLRPHVRYCEYERANVGQSSAVPGPVPVEQTVADLGAVVDTVSPGAPVVLVGGSFGGLVAYTFAGMHPERVAGVVLLDPTLPDEPGLERAFLAESMWVGPDAWQDSEEKIDVLAAYGTAQSALPTIPDVPGTIFVTADLWAPDGPNAEPFREAIRGQQADLIARFSPGETVTVDAPHAMISVVPDQIADAVLGIAGLPPTSVPSAGSPGPNTVGPAS